MVHNWYLKWFNEDYLNLYSDRNEEEAEKQVEFLIRHLNLTGNEKILDLACGAGRHSIAFGKRDFSVVGIDASESMIAQAKKKAAAVPNIDVTFMIGDMFSLDLNERFDVAISMFTSFGYGNTDTENSAILSSVRCHLTDQGTYILDYLHPYHVETTLVPYEEREINGEKVTITREIANNRINKRIIFPDREFYESVALYSREAIENLLRKNGLEPTEIWNDFDGTPWKKKGKRQIFKCTTVSPC